MLTMQEHLKFRHLKYCVICAKEYDSHWKVVNHIRKTKDDSHVHFILMQEEQFFQIYQATERQKFHENLFKANNIFCGLSFANSGKIIHKFTSKIDREQNRIGRISKTLSDVPKTPEHNQKVSKAVSTAWKDGKFATPEVVAARKRGYAGRKSFAGANNPMYGRACPQTAGRGKGGFRKDIGHYVRSTWEANICRVFQFMNRAYIYEKQRFRVTIDDIEMTYAPDIFDVKTQTFYEIKGHAKSSKKWACDCKGCCKQRKIIPFLQEKGIRIRIVGRYEYNRFKRFFQERVNWEK